MDALGLYSLRYNPGRSPLCIVLCWSWECWHWYGRVLACGAVHMNEKLESSSLKWEQATSVEVAGIRPGHQPTVFCTVLHPTTCVEQ